jgi:hypothetical protein
MSNSIGSSRPTKTFKNFYSKTKFNKIILNSSTTTASHTLFINTRCYKIQFNRAPDDG